ncbi:P63C domain-containing protein [Nostoc sp.]
MTEKMLKAEYGSDEQPLRIADIEIPCYVLEDGRRVITQGGMIQALGIARGSVRGRGGERIAIFVTGKNLSPFISKGLRDVSTAPIIFKPPRGNTAYGYEATVLADLCDAVLEARRAGALQKQQMHIAERCEILVRGFARVGIIALIDEATGYQAIRARNDLNKILEAYIAKELLPWTKMFPDEFYKELFRLRGWEYNPVSVKRPILVGKLTNKIVYKRLPSGVLEELKQKNPVVNGRRRHKYFQFLTEDIGNPHLSKHLAAVIALMRASSNWKVFERLLERAFPIIDVEYTVIPGMENVMNDDDIDAFGGEVN